MPAGSYPNPIKNALKTRDFLVTLEYTPAVSAVPFEEAVRRIAPDATRVAGDPRVHGFNVCDRVRSPDFAKAGPAQLEPGQTPLQELDAFAVIHPRPRVATSLPASEDRNPPLSARKKRNPADPRWVVEATVGRGLTTRRPDTLRR